MRLSRCRRRRLNCLNCHRRRLNYWMGLSYLNCHRRRLNCWMRLNLGQNLLLQCLRLFLLGISCKEFCNYSLRRRRRLGYLNCHRRQLSCLNCYRRRLNYLNCHRRRLSYLNCHRRRLSHLNCHRRRLNCWMRLNLGQNLLLQCLRLILLGISCKEFCNHPLACRLDYCRRRRLNYWLRLNCRRR